MYGPPPFCKSDTDAHDRSATVYPYMDSCVAATQVTNGVVVATASVYSASR
jgi:hypothetical protein